MVEVKRKKGESFDGMYRRFLKRVQFSGKILEAKERRFIKPEKSDSAKRKSALVALKYRRKREYLRKIGKLEEEPRRRW
ncbi:30S ribosomal protein S21 [Candidatus Falkowbacteria bacterium CG10_big_fil_rev_8_21_14_0_10_43_11]|uniref:30S ribosomal protein S21 n=1 Tax=Candidatus Falkowbacteria bacterium CG10_big_fil_rev_8_21_14_0_10_43_11 TaxID=1974568 RepID=A0A2M6WMX3_9BACT|nr:MAG: 30S ribosomal protein S21 [Candidatus Falkowbacteria bacterium CG10_big_fil_rev_8_21_14_0_10_43_11]